MCSSAFHGHSVIGLGLVYLPNIAQAQNQQNFPASSFLGNQAIFSRNVHDIPPLPSRRGDPPLELTERELNTKPKPFMSARSQSFVFLFGEGQEKNNQSSFFPSLYLTQSHWLSWGEERTPRHHPQRELHTLHFTPSKYVFHCEHNK